MEQYRAFKLLAHAALNKFDVNIGCFYGAFDNAKGSGAERWWLKVKGQGLPPEGLSAGHENYTVAIDGMVRLLKGHKRAKEEERMARDYAARHQAFTPEELEQQSAAS